MIAEGATVEGEIEIAELYLAGTVKGTIVAHRRLEVTPSGEIHGEVYSGNLIVRDGAIIDGVCHMDLPQDSEAKTSNPSKDREQKEKQLQPEGQRSNQQTNQQPKQQPQQQNQHKKQNQQQQKSTGKHQGSGKSPESKKDSPVWRRSNWDGAPGSDPRSVSQSKKA